MPTYNEKFQPNNCMSKTIAYIVMLMYCGLLISCGSIQSATQLPKAKKRSVKFLLQQVEKHHIDFSWFGTKAKMKFEHPDQKISFAASIRMQKDSLIWMTVKKANVEGFRVRITPDWIEILDRQKASYIKKPFAYIKDEFGLNLSFQDLQHLLIGNPILYQNETWNSTIKKGYNVLHTPPDQKEVLKLFFHPKSFLLHELTGSQNNDLLSITYSDYEIIEKEQIPTVKEVYIDSEQQGEATLKMTFYKMELNTPQKVKFIIPPSYSRD